jgi:hypothetical protein
MPKLLLLLGVLPIAGCMHAAQPPAAYATLPPAQYANTRVSAVVHYVDRARLAVACRNVTGGYDPSVNGCQISGSRPCTIYVLNERAEEAAQVEAHERAHCAGWRHG